MLRLSLSAKILLIFTLLILSVANSWAAPNLISYQGRLTDINGAAITDPALPMTFSIFDAATGGNQLWTEVQTVDVKDGIYTVLLGSTGTQNLDASVFNSDVTWLEVTVNGETMTPRQQFTSAAYAISAGSVANIQPTEIITQSDIGTAPGQVPPLDAGGKLDAAVIPENLAGVKIAYIKDVKPSGTHGGTATAGSWLTRDLNTLEGDTSFVSLSNNQFTLQPGSYDISIKSPAFVVSNYQSALFNVSSSNIEILGQTGYSNTSAPSGTNSLIEGAIVIPTTQSFEVRQMVKVTINNYGFGIASDLGNDEIYTIVKITKLD